MTQKFKKLLKNEKGFTLVELLAVIVILGIILAIAIPAIGSIINKAESDTAEQQNELILDAARLADVNDEFTSGTTTEFDLIETGYLDPSNDELKALDTDNPGRTIYYDDDEKEYTFTEPSN